MSVIRAQSFVGRLIGCLRFASIAPQDGMWFEPCTAVHTIGMRASIDIVLLDRRSTVVAIHAEVTPNRPYISHRRARTVVEMGAGFLQAAAIAIGDTLELVDFLPR